MSDRRNIRLNLWYSVLSKMVIIGIGLILPRVTILNYGSETNGLLNSANQLIAYLALFEAGIQAVALKSLYAPVATNKTDEINQILAAVNAQYRKSGTGYCIGLLVLSVVYALFIQSDSICFMSAFLIVFFSGFGKVVLFYFQGKYQILLLAEGKKYILVNLQTIISVLTGLAKVILLYMRINVVLVVFSSLLISLLQATYIMRYIHKHYTWIDLSVKPDYAALDEKNPALIHQISTLVFLNTDVLILTALCDLNTVSVYSLYKGIMTQITSLLYLLYDSFDFSMGQLFNTNRQRFVEKLDVVDTCYSAITFAVYSAVLIMLRPFIALYTQGVKDVSYIDSYLPLLFVTVEILAVCRRPMLCTISYAGHFGKTVSRTIIEMLLNLSLSLICVIKIGMHGVLLGTIVAMLYRTTDILIYTNTRILLRKPGKTLMKHGINLCMYMLAVLFSFLCPLNVPSYGAFLWKGTLVAVVCFLIYFVVQILLYPEQIRMVLRVIRKSEQS